MFRSNLIDVLLCNLVSSCLNECPFSLAYSSYIRYLGMSPLGLQWVGSVPHLKPGLLSMVPRIKSFLTLGPLSMAPRIRPRLDIGL